MYTHKPCIYHTYGSSLHLRRFPTLRAAVQIDDQNLWNGFRGTWAPLPIESMYGIYANIGGILMVNVTIYSIHGSYGLGFGADRPIVGIVGSQPKGGWPFKFEDNKPCFFS